MNHYNWAGRGCRVFNLYSTPIYVIAVKRRMKWNEAARQFIYEHGYNISKEYR